MNKACEFKVKNQRHLDHILRCERHLPPRVFNIGSDDLSISLQGDSVVYVNFEGIAENCGNTNCGFFSTTTYYLLHLTDPGCDEYRHTNSM